MKRPGIALSCGLLLARCAAGTSENPVSKSPDFGVSGGVVHRWGAGRHGREARAPGGLKDKAKNKPHIFFIDAGSSGSKVFTFCPEKHTAKLMTQCREDAVKAGKFGQGVAALAYSQEDCGWLVGPEKHPEEVKPLLRPKPDFALNLLALLQSTYAACKVQDVGHSFQSVRNAAEVPILATAGMRLVSQADNDKVWGYICGEGAADGSPLRLAQRGDRCGTIPGTTEAYYEFLANAAKGQSSRVLTGTFTIGGASAQIAIPLTTPQEVRAFQELRDRIRRELDCTALKLSSGEQVPYFNEVREGGPKKACVDDYITFRPWHEIQVGHALGQEAIRISHIQGVGLISFLGLRGSGSFVAGGINEVQYWAEREGCGAKRNANRTFDWCVAHLQDALSKDIMWKHVTQYFHRNALDIRSFSYNTNAAVPSKAGMQNVDGQDQGWELEAELEKACGKDPDLRFGHKKSNTCMRAMYTALYMTAFFHPTGAEGHGPEKLHFDPDRDWVEGKLEEERAFLQKARVRTHRASASASAASLLSVPLRRHTFDYAEGAALHFGAVA